MGLSLKFGSSFWAGALLTAGCPLWAQQITTVAGIGSPGFSGDGGPAAQAAINNAVYVAADSFGNLFIADENNNRIRRVDSNGIITTVAGNGAAGFSGDGGPAVQASLNLPTGVCTDAAGNLFIADLANFRIRKLDTSGNITTVAGNGVKASNGDGGPATQASMFLPIRCVVDPSGNLYVTDQGAHKIRKIDPSGIISTFAGTGAFLGVSADFSGDGGPATAADLNNPTAVTVDSTGNIYFSDQFNHRIREVDTNGIITTIAGVGIAGYSGDNIPATSSLLNYPGGLIVDQNGDLYFADATNNRIRKISNGTITTVAGTSQPGFTGDNGPANLAQFNNPFGIAMDAAGNLYIADINNSRIREIAGVGAGVTPQFTPASVTDAQVPSR